MTKEQLINRREMLLDTLSAMKPISLGVNQIVKELIEIQKQINAIPN